MADSPTGRLPSEPEMQRIKVGTNPEIIVCGVDIDFSEIETRLIAAFGSPAVAEIVLELEGRGELRPIGYDFDAMIERHEIRAEKARTTPQPSYLHHDKTKRGYGRGRR